MSKKQKTLLAHLIAGGAVRVGVGHGALAGKAASPSTPVDPEKAAEKAAQRAHRRQRAMEELISTEETYVKQLKGLIKLYANELRDFRIMSEKDYYTVFPNDLRTIAHLNATLLADLQLRCEDYDNERTIISDILLEFAPFFKMYQIYMNNNPAASATVARLCDSSKSFLSFVTKQRKAFDNLHLSGLLILPVQRIPRYKIIVDEIVKNTAVSHPDYDGLKLALTEIIRVNKDNNERLREIESRAEVMRVELEVGARTAELVTPSRLFVAECQCHLLKPSSKKVFQATECKLYLFNDLLLLATPRSDMLAILGTALRAASSPYTLKCRMPINEAFSTVDLDWLISDATPTSPPPILEHCLGIVSCIESFVVQFASPKAKEKWQESVNQALEDFQVSLSAGDKFARGESLLPSLLKIPSFLTHACMKCGEEGRARDHCGYCGHLCCVESCFGDLSLPDRVDPTDRALVCGDCFAENSQQTASTKKADLSSRKLATRHGGVGGGLALGGGHALMAELSRKLKSPKVTSDSGSVMLKSGISATKKKTTAVSATTSPRINPMDRRRKRSSLPTKPGTAVPIRARTDMLPTTTPLTTTTRSSSQTHLSAAAKAAAGLKRPPPTAPGGARKGSRGRAVGGGGKPPPRPRGGGRKPSPGRKKPPEVIKKSYTHTSTAAFTSERPPRSSSPASKKKAQIPVAMSEKRAPPSHKSMLPASFNFMAMSEKRPRPPSPGGSSDRRGAVSPLSPRSPMESYTTKPPVFPTAATAAGGSRPMAKVRPKTPGPLKQISTEPLLFEGDGSAKRRHVSDDGIAEGGAGVLQKSFSAKMALRSKASAAATAAMAAKAKREVSSKDSATKSVVAAKKKMSKKRSDKVVVVTASGFVDGLKSAVMGVSDAVKAKVLETNAMLSLEDEAVEEKMGTVQPSRSGGIKMMKARMRPKEIARHRASTRMRAAAFGDGADDLCEAPTTVQSRKRTRSRSSPWLTKGLPPPSLESILDEEETAETETGGGYAAASDSSSIASGSGRSIVVQRAVGGSSYGGSRGRMAVAPPRGGGGYRRPPPVRKKLVRPGARAGARTVAVAPARGYLASSSGGSSSGSFRGSRVGVMKRISGPSAMATGMAETSSEATESAEELEEAAAVALGARSLVGKRRTMFVWKCRTIFRAPNNSLLTTLNDMSRNVQWFHNEAGVLNEVKELLRSEPGRPIHVIANGGQDNVEFIRKLREIGMLGDICVFCTFDLDKYSKLFSPMPGVWFAPKPEDVVEFVGKRL